MLNVKVSCAYIYIMTLLSFYLTYSQLYLVQYQKQFETMYRVNPTVNHVTFVFTLRTNELLFYTHGIKHLSHINLKPVLFFNNTTLTFVQQVKPYVIQPQTYQNPAKIKASFSMSNQQRYQLHRRSQLLQLFTGHFCMCISRSHQVL